LIGPCLNDGDRVAFIQDGLENLDAACLAIERSAPTFSSLGLQVESDSPQPFWWQNPLKCPKPLRRARLECLIGNPRTGLCLHPRGSRHHHALAFCTRKKIASTAKGSSTNHRQPQRYWLMSGRRLPLVKPTTLDPRPVPAWCSRAFDDTATAAVGFQLSGNRGSPWHGCAPTRGQSSRVSAPTAHCEYRPQHGS
jgi:hypothetical protein